MSPGQFDEEILQTAVERREVLAALAESPHHRQEMQAELDISKTTCHRIVRTLDDMGLLRRTDNGYALSKKGRLVNDQVQTFYRNVEAACELEDLAAAFDQAPVEFDIELFADATITRPKPDDPSPPISRDFELFQEAETLRTVEGSRYIPPLYFEQVIELGLEKGMQGEFIAPKQIAKERITQFPDAHRAMLEEEASLRYWICEDVPFGLTLYDTHVVVRSYDDETGSVQFMADTDDPDALEWAADVVDQYREMAAAPSEIEDLPDWLPEPEIDFS